MLAEARRRLPDVRFELSDIANWRPRQRPDLIFANAALQWLPDHEALFPRLMSHLAEDGALAVQMPDNRQEPSHALMRLVAADGPWADRLVPIAKTRAVIATHGEYYAWLKPLSAALDIWQTTYVHPMAGVGAVVDWFRGSALRPFLNPLDACEREQFIERYMRELAVAYGVEPDGSLLFLYPRLFILARKRGGRA
jgi:trans-aconitate 2-methyltransferase